MDAIETSIREPGQARTRLYYAHPGSSWVHGTNEYINKMMRRFISKGTDIGKICYAEVGRIKYWVINYPKASKKNLWFINQQTKGQHSVIRTVYDYTK